MTNEEWIKSLPTNDFAKYLTCRACKRSDVDKEQDKCFGSCDIDQIEWLKAVHNDK